MTAASISETSDSIELRHLSGGGGVDVGAEESLSEDGDEAALGLLTSSGAGVDELVDVGRSDRRRSAVKVGEVQDIGRAADWVAGRAKTNLTLLKRGSEGRDGESEDSGVEHVDGLVW